MDATIKLYSLNFREVKTYLYALLFVAGNIILPQLFNLIPGGGMVWLPIYFFTLIASYKYGLHVGLLTAIFSPLINSLLFGMPPMTVLPVMIIKSAMLAVAASFVAREFDSISLWGILAVILTYQSIGVMAEWIITANFSTALQDFRISFPGMILQLVGGYLFLRFIGRF